MDIELSLRELLVLENPGPRFTDGVMSRVGDASAGLPRDGVVRLADARARKRTRRILLGTLLAIGAAAAMLPLIQRARVDAPVVRQAVAALAGESSAADPAPQKQSRSDTLAAGAGGLDCIDPDLLRGLLLQMPDQVFHVSAAAAPELADFKAPRQFTWIGATERSVGTTSQSSVAAVYRTGLAPDAARTAAVGALTTDGWTLQSTGPFRNAGVFTAPNSGSADSYCRDGKTVEMGARALDGVTYVVLSASRGADVVARATNACDQSPQPGARSGAEFDQYLPQLELPRDPDTGQPVPMQGSSGGGSSNVKRRMSVSFTLKGSADGVARHFARQIGEQGWSSDASWSGTGTAGSTWTRRADADTVLRGTLMVSAFDAGKFIVVFQVASTK